MEQYTVTGMSCAACSTRVEKAVSKVPGVTSCSVSLLTNSMGVEGTASADSIVAAVTEAGYGASLKGAEAESRSFCGRRRIKRQRDTGAETTSDHIDRIPRSADVFLYGTYDVGLAAAVLV